MNSEQLYETLGFPGGSDGKESAWNVGSWVWSQGWEDPLEKVTATHSNIMAWKILWTEEPVGYNPCGSKESDVTEWLSLTHTRRGLPAHRNKTKGQWRNRYWEEEFKRW